MTKLFSLVAIFALLTLCGCGGGSSTIAPTPPERAKSAYESSTHTHAAPHGGIVNNVAGFHVEVVVDSKASKLTAYILGEDAVTNKTIEAKSLAAEARPEGSDKFIS